MRVRLFSCGNRICKSIDRILVVMNYVIILRNNIIIMSYILLYTHSSLKKISFVVFMSVLVCVCVR